MPGRFVEGKDKTQYQLHNYTVINMDKNYYLMNLFTQFVSFLQEMELCGIGTEKDCFNLQNFAGLSIFGDNPNLTQESKLTIDTSAYLDGLININNKFPVGSVTGCRDQGLIYNPEQMKVVLACFYKLVENCLTQGLSIKKIDLNTLIKNIYFCDI